MPDVTFDYRIDRHHRVLRRVDMFPNPYHPSKVPMADFYVCNSLYATNLRCGLERLGPGHAEPPKQFPNEHLILHLSGPLRWSTEGQSYDAAPGDLLFVPAFVDYQFENVGTTEAWLLSCYLRIAEWHGLNPAATTVAPDFRHHRFLPYASRAVNASHPDASTFGRDWTVYEPIEATNVKASLIEVPPGGGRPPRQDLNEHMVCLLHGELEWRVEGQEFTLRPQDLLFIPAYVPFSFVNRGDSPSQFLSSNVRLGTRSG